MSAFTWALLTALVWGVVPLMEKIGLGGAPPAVGVLVRSLGIVLGLIVFSFCGAPWALTRSLPWPSIVLLVGGGLLASFVGQMMFYHALRSGAVSQVTPVAGAYPLVAALLGWFVLREPMTAMRVAGVALIVAGVMLLRK
jgi:transporter family protein